MRRVKKVLGLISGILLAGAFITGCNPDVTTGNGNEEESDKYSISFQKDISSLSVEAGDSITINVSESTGTWKIAEATVPASIEVSSESDESGSLSSITITGVSVTSSASFTIYPEEAGDDESYDKTISVAVTDPYFTFTLTLDDDLAEEASTIEVTYGSSQHTGSENADVTYTAGEKTATVKFEKSVADEWNYFNNITVSVYDSSENLLNTSLDSNNYFQYTDTSFTGYTVSFAVDSEMTVNFTFFDFTAASVKVTYGYDSTTETVDGVVADDGASASVQVSSTYANSSGWMQIVELLAYNSDGQEISVEMKTSNSWFEYNSSSSAEFEYALKDDSAYTEIYSESYAAGTIDLSELSGVSVSELLIEAKDCDWSAVTDDWWIWTTPGNLGWIEETYYKLSVTDSSTIATLIENGLAISASDGLSATIVISYK
jgi:hypothetical protein